MGVVYFVIPEASPYSNCTLLIDDEFFANIKNGMVEDKTGMLIDIVVNPGKHKLTFLLKTGVRRNLEVNLTSGENSLEYSPDMKLWILNSNEEIREI